MHWGRVMMVLFHFLETNKELIKLCVENPPRYQDFQSTPSTIHIERNNNINLEWLNGQKMKAELFLTEIHFQWSTVVLCITIISKICNYVYLETILFDNANHGLWYC